MEKNEQVETVASAVKDEKTLMQEFANEYNALCEKHGFQISAVPTWVATNHGSFEMAISVSIVRLNK